MWLALSGSVRNNAELAVRTTQLAKKSFTLCNVFVENQNVKIRFEVFKEQRLLKNTCTLHIVKFIQLHEFDPHSILKPIEYIPKYLKHVPTYSMKSHNHKLRGNKCYVTHAYKKLTSRVSGLLLLSQKNNED